MKLVVDGEVLYLSFFIPLWTIKRKKCSIALCTSYRTISKETSLTRRLQKTSLIIRSRGFKTSCLDLLKDFIVKNGLIKN